MEMGTLSREDVRRKLGVKTLEKFYAVIRDPSFPKPVRFPGYKHARWVETEIDKWFQEYIKNARTA